MRVWDLPLVAATTTNVKAGSAPGAQGATQFNANQHPRGADGTFITTGGTVQVLGPDGKPIAEGQVNAIIQTPQGPMIQLKNPSTGQVLTVAPSQLKQAPQAIAHLSAPGTQVIPGNPTAAASAGRADARRGVTARTGTDPYGNPAAPALLAAYQAAYHDEQVKLQGIAARKAAAAAKKAAAAAKKASGQAGGSAYKPPRAVKPAGWKHY